MVQDLYNAGFSIIDKDVLSRFAAPTIRQARMQLKDERSAYEEALGKATTDRLVDQYDQTPDDQKPFYSIRFAMYVAAAERQRRIVAETEALSIKHSRSLTDKERQDYDKLKRGKVNRQLKAAQTRRRRESGKTKKK